MDIVPFGDAWLDGAGELLARRHRRCSATEPALPARFEDAMGARTAVEATWRAPAASGVAAIDGSRVAGFLLGAPQIDTLRGRSAWVPFAGHAMAEDAGAELYRDLYAALSPHWVDAGCFAHYAMLPASDTAALNAWFRLGFGLEQAHGICDLAAESPPAPARGTFEIRRAIPTDIDAILSVAGVVADHQARPPVYGITLPEHRAEWREDYARLLADPDTTLWLALSGGRVAGFQLYTPARPSDPDLLVPDGCIELKLGATCEDERGRGIARALTEYGLAAARAQGHRFCIADWRVTSLLASRFWPRRGFRPTAYRLHRHIDERIVWAHGETR